MNSDLLDMKKKWGALGIVSYFPQVHHFSSPRFKTKPSGMDVFIRWCEKREIKTENCQTIKRAIRAADLFKSTRDIEKAIKEAWKDCPVLRRAET